MASIGKSIGYNFFAQLFGRIISFIINVYLLRVIDSEVIGIVNVRLTLLYNTILFLTREPLRKGKIFEGTLPQFVNIVWLSPVIATVLSVICVAFWNVFSSTSREIPTFVLLAFPLSAIIESIGEPFAVFSLRFSLTAHYAWSQCLLISFQRIFVLFLLLFTNSYEHLMIYALAQIFASISYTVFHFWCFFKFSKQRIPELNLFPSFKSFFPSFNLGFNTNAISNLTHLFGHSFLKQLATDSSGYLMTFTEITSLKNQAVFDAIEKLGSLVCRIVLAPLEESCAAHFRNEIHNASKTLRKSFIDILHVSSVIGLIVCIFGVPYSKVAVWLYGGKLLVENGGDLLLSVYCVYIFVMAVNGITECFAMATMGNAQLLKHSYFLFFLALLQPFLAYHLVSIVGVSGFIVSKCIDMILRIIFSWLQSRKFFGSELMITDILPSWSILLSILLTFSGAFFSSQYFEATEFMQSLCHLVIGGILFVLLSLYVVFYDPVFNMFVGSKVKSK